ncbi:TonB-dependent siderophore receptor [Falsirhodobacter algicola]|uniref:TonB-dependent siderophore receptor n=1 Tax=Falsirhodobacter algicola TaxID=2692330 RepID=A0A8J8SM52_9RHOB|nr:TonB-dependent siderophore receptor [Falsirhodobacter algicola]QUS37046.1 TonB-dependent siderophore receptor [Falsirhodobacter algicola]
MHPFRLKSPAIDRPRSLIAALTVGTALIPAVLHAQETALAPIVVEGTSDDTAILATSATSGSKMQTEALDSSAAVSVVTAEEIRMRNADTLEKTLSYSAGVLTDEYGGGDDRYDYIRIRGFLELDLGTYRDGLPVRGFGWTFAPREPYGFERVEVLKGSNSSLFGLNAPGGLVNAVTKTPKPYRFGEVYTTVGTNSTEVGADFGDVLDADGVWSYRIVTKTQEGDLGTDYSNDDRRYVAGSLSYRPSDRTELTFMLDYNRREGVPGTGDLPDGFDLDSDVFLGEPDFNRFDTTERSYGYSFAHDFGGGLSLRQTARYTNIDLDYEQVYGASEDGRSAFAVYGESKQFAVDTQLQYDATFGQVKSRTLAGFQYDWIHADEDSYYGTAPGIDADDPVYSGRDSIALYSYLPWQPEQYSRGIYLQEELTFADRWILTFGGRHDNVDLTGFNSDYEQETVSYSAFTKRVGLTYKATPGLSVYANYSESFEPNSFAVDDDPKEGEQYEIGVKYRPVGTDLLITASAFDLTQTNISSTVEGQIVQTGEIEVQGFELEAKGRLTDAFAMTASWSYWHGEITEDGDSGNEGNRPIFVPRNIVSLWGNYTLPARAGWGETTFGLGGRYVSATYSDEANEYKVGGRTLFDAAATYQITPNVELQANVSNLFDKSYIGSYSYSGNYYRGEGREVSATLRYTW